MCLEFISEFLGGSMMIYSYSRLKCFEQCPQKYKFRYINKVRTEVKESVELFLGRRVHEALRKLYWDLRYQKMNTLEGLLSFLRDEWNKKWNDSIVIVKERYSQEDYLKMAEKYIADYYHRYYPFNHGRTIALEKRIFIDLDGSSDYKLCGYIDRVAKAEDGCYEIHDYKTCSRLPSPGYIQKNRQLALYAIGLMERYPHIRNVRLIWHFLKFNKEIVSTPSDEELNELKQNTVSLIDEIESTKKFPTNPSRLCDWCRFRSVCRVSSLYRHRKKEEGFLDLYCNPSNCLEVGIGVDDSAASI